MMLSGAACKRRGRRSQQKSGAPVPTSLSTVLSSRSVRRPLHRPQEKQFSLCDFGSAGGTFVRLATGIPTPLYPGMMIMLGKHQVRCLDYSRVFPIVRLRTYVHSRSF